MSMTTKIASAQASGVATAGQVLTVVVTGKAGIRSFAFSYEGIPLPAGRRSFQRQPSPSDILVAAIGAPGSQLDWQVEDHSGNIINNSSGNPAKRSTIMPNGGPAFDGMSL